MKILAAMKMMLLASTAHSMVSAFAPASVQKPSPAVRNHASGPSSVRRVEVMLVEPNCRNSSPLMARSAPTESDGGFFSDLTINPSYAAFYLAFLSVATYMSLSEAPGASQALIDKFIADPLHPGFGSSLFESEWNLIGLVGLPLACLIMPGAKGQKLNPAPFLFGSVFAGYGSLGPVMMTRKAVTSVEKDELGWFTINVLENKIFNWATFLLFANAYLISGVGEGLWNDFGGTFKEFSEMIQGAALGTATTVDFLILCLTGASLIPEDLKRRGVEDEGKAYAVAASTLLLPAAGLALYAALRPTLDEE